MRGTRAILSGFSVIESFERNAAPVPERSGRGFANLKDITFSIHRIAHRESRPFPLFGENLATKRCAATAVGLTGIFGYASSIVSGWGLGSLVDHYGWGIGFISMTAAAGAGAVFFLLAWAAPAHGYDD